jgi:hypothetical protein
VSLNDQDQIEHLVIDLTRELGEQEIPAETIRQEVTRVYDSFNAAKIRQYVPVLARRIVRERFIGSQARSDRTWVRSGEPTRRHLDLNARLDTGAVAQERRS